jgi:multimeric flavodoxin WrbA
MDIQLLGISGSPRKGNTLIMVHEALKAAEAIEGVRTELFSFYGKKISPCIDCDRCPVSDEHLCSIRDLMDDLYPRMIRADGIILGAPVYFGTINAQVKCMMDRCRPLGRKGQLLMHKVAGGITVGGARSGGQDNALKDIHYFFVLLGIFPVGLVRHLQIGAMGLGWRPGAIMDDQWHCQYLGRDIMGLDEARSVGRRVALCARLIKTGLQSFDPSRYDETWQLDRDKIPDLYEARKRMKKIEKDLHIQSI